MALTINESCEVTLAQGLEKTGKTRAIVARASELVESGVDISDIIVFAASPDAARVLSNSFACANKTLAGVKVLVPAQYALEVLGAPEAVEATGRNARILSRYEESFFMEDLKVCGIRPGRIRGMVNFFYKEWEDLSFLNEGWLIYIEERELHTLVKQTLASYKAYTSCEVVPSSVDVLLKDFTLLQKVQKKHVLVDDFTYMSRASQQLALLIARESVFVAANNKACAPAFDRYPNRDGAIELLEACKNATQIDLDESSLSQDVIAALSNLDALANDACFAGSDSALSTDHVRACDTPADEYTYAAEWVSGALEMGAEPRDIAVVVPDKVWERNVSKALQAKNIAVRKSSETGNIGGDIRYLDLSQAAQCLTLLILASNPQDEAALRAWCGFGDYNTCRSLFSELYDGCRQTGISLAEVLGNICDGINDGSLRDSGEVQFLNDAETVTARLNILNEALVSLEKLSGNDVLREIANIVMGKGEELPFIFAALLRNALPSDSATTLAAKAMAELHFPHLVDENAVAIVTPSRALGLEATHVIITGMVNGFAPAHTYFDRMKTSPEKAQTMISREALNFRPALSLGEKAIAVTSFEKMRATDAQTLNVYAERFFIEDGTRYARIARSYIADCILGLPVDKIE